MSDYTELQKAAAYAAQDTIKFADEDEEMRALQQFHEEVDPETILALIAENERLGVDLKSVVRLNNENADLFKTKNDQLRSEIAGLKTGYEAYERVNAELKAEVGALRGLTETAQKGAELLSKDAGRYRWLLQNWFTMSSEYMGGVSFQTGRSRWSDLPDEAVSEAIDAALGQGEQP